MSAQAVQKSKKKQKTSLKVVKAEVVPMRTSAVADKAVSEAVAWINKKVEETLEKGFSGLLEIGQYLLKHFFGGKTEAVSFRGRQKESTFRTLAGHPDLKISQTWIHNAVHLAIQEQQLLEEGVDTGTALSNTHRVELLRVKDLGDKRRLVEEVREKHLSVRQLHERIDQVAGKMLPATPAGKAERGFRIPRPVLMVNSFNLDRLLGEKRLKRFTPKQLETYHNELERAKETIGQMLRAIERVRNK